MLLTARRAATRLATAASAVSLLPAGIALATAEQATGRPRGTPRLPLEPPK